MSELFADEDELPYRPAGEPAQVDVDRAITTGSAVISERVVDLTDDFDPWALGACVMVDRR